MTCRRAFNVAQPQPGHGNGTPNRPTTWTTRGPTSRSRVCGDMDVPGHRSGDDYPDRYRHLSLAAGLAPAPGLSARPTTVGAHEFCQEDPERLYFAAMLPLQNPKYAVEELHRVAEQGCRVGLVRPIDAMGNYPIQAQVRAAVERDGRDGAWSTACTPSPRRGSLKPPGYTEQYSGAELIGRDGALPPACRTSF